MSAAVDKAEAWDAIAAKNAEIDRLLGLLWYAYHEFNAIHARSGAPLDHHGMTLCTEEYWAQMTDAFRAALPEADRTPWPSARAIAALPPSQQWGV
jgi:hypothetical protein